MEPILRLVLACISGACIGWERSHRQKEAGLRTHIILSLSACLLMLISKYGFFDVIYINSAQVDVSRTASTVISGISFLGAGMIFVRSGSIKGLTTAAGIIATASIGMSFGAGLYLLGITATALLVFIQILLHWFVPRSEVMESNELAIVMKNDREILNELQKKLNGKDMIVRGASVRRRDDDLIDVRLMVRTAKDANLEQIFSVINQYDEVKELSVSL